MTVNHEPVIIYGPKCNAVLVGECDWIPINEPLILLLAPGMRESIAESTRERLATAPASWTDNDASDLVSVAAKR